MLFFNFLLRDQQSFSKKKVQYRTFLQFDKYGIKLPGYRKGKNKHTKCFEISWVWGREIIVISFVFVLTITVVTLEEVYQYMHILIYGCWQEVVLRTMWAKHSNNATARIIVQCLASARMFFFSYYVCYSFKPAWIEQEPWHLGAGQWIHSGSSKPGDARKLFVKHLYVFLFWSDSNN